MRADEEWRECKRKGVQKKPVGLTPACTYLASGADSVPTSAHHGPLHCGAPVGGAGADAVVHAGQVCLLQGLGQLPVGWMGNHIGSQSKEKPFPRSPDLNVGPAPVSLLQVMGPPLSSLVAAAASLFPGTQSPDLLMFVFTHSVASTVFCLLCCLH